MNILFLGEINSPILSWLKGQGESVVQTSESIERDYLERNNVTFLISYGYRHILKRQIIEFLPNRAINLHISYLPWNRGANPNFWSFVDDSPKGVTIHYIDEGIDTGDIILQSKVEFDIEVETLATTYSKLHIAIEELFKKNWGKIREGKSPRIKQIGNGSFHLVSDQTLMSKLLLNGWDTPVSSLVDYSAAQTMSRLFRDAYCREVHYCR